MSEVSQHFVTFYSPGTLVAETTQKPIESWDSETAMRMADEICERHGATPYGFRFTTRSRESNELDSKETASSNFYYLGGIIETLEQVRERNDPKEHILRSNMECNNCERIIVNDNSWRWTQMLEDTDVVLDYTPPNKR